MEENIKNTLKFFDWNLEDFRYIFDVDHYTQQIRKWENKYSFPLSLNISLICFNDLLKLNVFAKTVLLIVQKNSGEEFNFNLLFSFPCLDSALLGIQTMEILNAKSATCALN